jgi:hypothetical protein
MTRRSAVLRQTLCRRPAAGRDEEPWVGEVTADTANCPETVTKLPGGGHENCPLTAMRSARHDSVCLAAFGG